MTITRFLIKAAAATAAAGLALGLAAGPAGAGPVKESMETMNSVVTGLEVRPTTSGGFVRWDGEDKTLLVSAEIERLPRLITL